jgi:AcrR family transcriptional regulator
MNGNPDAINLPANKHQERSVRTREALLEATIGCLIERGYAGTSTAEVCARAGLSRGAQLHQFHTRAELLAHALERLLRKHIDLLRDAVDALPPGPGRERAVVDVVFSTFSGPPARASMELWVASASDPELREHVVRVQRRLTRELLDVSIERRNPEVAADQVETLFWLTIYIVRGLILDEMIGGDPGRRQRVVETWKTLAENALAPPGEPLTRSGDRGESAGGRPAGTG